jgi:hypothetical protein
LDSHAIGIDSESKRVIEFKINDAIPKEGYHLETSDKGVSIEYSDPAGQFYALQTLNQLIISDSETNALQTCRIQDAPAHKIRGYMLDVGRNFMSLESLKDQLDIMARYKLNVFQWHLTDRPAWRVENKKYPELTHAANHRPTRDPGKYYTYDEIRELIHYANDRQIMVIPEIDMPGHSDSFITAMDCKMESEKGMRILEDVLNEFFEEIPKELCPIIHLGSDEVHIDNPKEFIDKMVGICENNQRQVMIWNPGLKADKSVIRQTWQSKHMENENYVEIDSWNNYINNSEPMTGISKLFFKPIGYESANEIIGGIICMWPDVNMEHEEDYIDQNPVYPSLLTYTWATWTADISKAPKEYYTILPAKGTKAHSYFEAFEDYLIAHKKRYFKGKPFQYFKQSDKEWLLSKPGPVNNSLEIQTLLTNRSTTWKKAIGNTIIIKDRFKLGGHFPEAKPGETVFAKTTIYSDQTKKVKTLIGFETPLRANRTYSGIPQQGSWDANGGNLWINGQELAAPLWENPGWKPSKSSGWGSREDQEIPWSKEELYWTRKPVEITLQKGRNTVLISVPSSDEYQNWMFTFIPLDMDGLHFSIIEQ